MILPVTVFTYLWLTLRYFNSFPLTVSGFTVYWIHFKIHFPWEHWQLLHRLGLSWLVSSLTASQFESQYRNCSNNVFGSFLQSRPLNQTLHLLSSDIYITESSPSFHVCLDHGLPLVWFHLVLWTHKWYQHLFNSRNQRFMTCQGDYIKQQQTIQKNIHLLSLFHCILILDICFSVILFSIKGQLCPCPPPLLASLLHSLFLQKLHHQQTRAMFSRWADLSGFQSHLCLCLCRLGPIKSLQTFSSALPHPPITSSIFSSFKLTVSDIPLVWLHQTLLDCN